MFAGLDPFKIWGERCRDVRPRGRDIRGTSGKYEPVQNRTRENNEPREGERLARGCGDLNPNNDGARIILNIPPLTEERRKELTKLVGEFAENGKIAVRRIREDLRKKAKNAVGAEEISEDEEKVFDKKLQEKIDATNAEVESAAKKKENEMMKV